MHNYCNNCSNCNDCNHCNYSNCHHNKYIMDSMNYCSSECDQYKEKSDELYMKAKYIQQESSRMLCQAKSLEEEAREIERRAKEIYTQSKVAYSEACNLESESHSLLDLADFYCHKAHECYKNTTKNCKEKDNYKVENTCGSNTSTCCNKGMVSNSSSRCTTPKYNDCCN